MLGSVRQPSRPAAVSVCRSSLVLALALLLTASAAASVPTDAATRAKVIGQPVALVVQPPAINLSGPRAVQQVVVSGRYADGSVRDLTPFCDFNAEAADIAAAGPEGFLTPRN